MILGKNRKYSRRLQKQNKEFADKENMHEINFYQMWTSVFDSVLFSPAEVTTY